MRCVLVLLLSFAVFAGACYSPAERGEQPAGEQVIQKEKKTEKSEWKMKVE